MIKLLKNKTRIAFSFLVIGVIMLLLFDFSQAGTAENIEDQTIQYSNELGWINWSHAIPNRNIKEFSRFQSLQLSQKDSFDFSFTMDMKVKISNKFIVASCSNTYRVPVVTSIQENKNIYTQIFGEVSILLEEMQGELPFSLLSGSRASSHRNGDITGNIISLYSSYTNLSLNDIKKDLSLLEIDDSIEKNKKDHIDKYKVSSFSEIKFIDTKKNQTTKSINDLLNQLKSKTIYCKLLTSRSAITIN